MSITSRINHSVQGSLELRPVDRGQRSSILFNETGQVKSPDNDSGSQTPYEQHVLDTMALGFVSDAVSDPAKLTGALHLAFGDKASDAQINQLASQIISGDTPMPRSVEFVNAGTLGANVSGVYIADNGGRILLDGSLLNDPVKLKRVFLEELGHHFDTTLGGVDSAGDEGAIFAESLQSGTLDSARLNTLRSENDAGVMTIHGKSVAVEQYYGGASMSSNGSGYTGPGSSPGTGGLPVSSSSSSSTPKYTGPGSSPGTGGLPVSSSSPSSTPKYTGPGSSPGTGGLPVSSSSPSPVPKYTGPGSSPGTGGLPVSSFRSSSVPKYTGPGSSPGTGGLPVSSFSPSPVPKYTGPGSSPGTGGLPVSSFSSSSVPKYTGPGSSPAAGGLPSPGATTQDSDALDANRVVRTNPISIRQIEQHAEQLRERAQSLSDDIDALGTSSGYVTEATRAELLDVLVEIEGGDISTAWQVRGFMEEGLTLGEARIRAREEAAQTNVPAGVSNDPSVTGLNDDQFQSMVNALVADGMAPTDAADTVFNSATEHNRERRDTMTSYIANLLNVPPLRADEIIAFNQGETGSIEGLPTDVSDALSRVEIRFINGTEQPFLVGQPRDVEIIGDHFWDTTGAELSAYGLNDGTWATVRPFDAHMAQSAPFDVHLFLDVLGFVPVVGEVADGLNAVIYLAEGDYLNAGISAVALIPVAGSTATGARVLARSQDMINGLGAVLKGTTKVDGVTINLLEMSDGSIIKVLELEDGQSVVVRGSAEALGESVDDIAATGRIGGEAPGVSAPTTREIPFDSDDVLVGTSRSNMRRDATKIIADDPDHPLRFLLNEGGTGFKPADGTSHFDLINQPDVVQMGHVVSAKTGHTEYVVLQTAYENQILNNSIERSGIGGAVLGFPVIEIGGVAVSRETAELWELLEYLPAGTVANAPRVNIPAPPPGT